MAGNPCGFCKQELGDKFQACDSCHILLHYNEKCTGLSSSELRAVVLQRRSLVFFCSDCRSAFKSVPQLIRQMSDLKLEVESLRKEIATLREQSLSTVSEELFYEIQERSSRASNFILFNAAECASNTLADKISYDRDIVKSVLEKIGADNTMSSVVSVVRIGKLAQSKSRPIKVICSSPHMVKTVLKSKKKLYDTGYRVNADQTRMQREYLKKVQNDLKSRQEQGEDNITIRYYSGVPRIVQNHTQKN